MRMKKLAAALMTLTALAGCGGDDNSAGDTTGTHGGGGQTSTPPPSVTQPAFGGGSYCDDLKSAKAQLSGLDGNFTADKFTAINLAVHKIADEAPGDIKDSWTLVADEFDGLQKALSDAGLSMDDFSKLTQGGAPSIDPTKLQALQKALQSFDTKGLTQATNKITAEVKSECGIGLK
jgi:hypothetical protein